MFKDEDYILIDRTIIRILMEMKHRKYQPVIEKIKHYSKIKIKSTVDNEHMLKLAEYLDNKSDFVRIPISNKDHKKLISGLNSNYKMTDSCEKYYNLLAIMYLSDIDLLDELINQL